jgi:hypothetical protein
VQDPQDEGLELKDALCHLVDGIQVSVVTVCDDLRTRIFHWEWKVLCVFYAPSVRIHLTIW